VGNIVFAVRRFEGRGAQHAGLRQSFAGADLSILRLRFQEGIGLINRF
jgi:hypothetical protein